MSDDDKSKKIEEIKIDGFDDPDDSQKDMGAFVGEEQEQKTTSNQNESNEPNKSFMSKWVRKLILALVVLLVIILVGSVLSKTLKNTTGSEYDNLTLEASTVKPSEPVRNIMKVNPPLEDEPLKTYNPYSDTPNNEKEVFSKEESRLLLATAIQKLQLSLNQNINNNHLELRLLIEKNKNDLMRLEKSHDNFVTKDDLHQINSDINLLIARLKNDQKEIDLLKTLTANLSKDVNFIKSMPINTTRKRTSKKTKAKKKLRYRLASAMKGRAWVVSRRDGRFVLLEEGDNLLGYGQILKITSDGHIHTVVGEVDLIRN